jgi:hypothetical protein
MDWPVELGNTDNLIYNDALRMWHLYTVQSQLSETMWTEATSDNTEELFGVHKLLL